MHFIINTHHQDAVQNNMGWWSHLVSAPETYSNPPIGIPASLLKGNFSASTLKSWCSCFTMTLFRCWTQETPKHLLLTTTCNYPEPPPFELKVLEKFEIFWRKCSWIKTTCQKVWTCDKWTKKCVFLLLDDKEQHSACHVKSSYHRGELLQENIYSPQF